MIKYPFANLCMPKITKETLSGIFAFREVCFPWDNLTFVNNPYHMTKITPLAGKDKKAEHIQKMNYEHCIQVTATLLKKYATSFFSQEVS